MNKIKNIEITDKIQEDKGLSMKKKENRSVLKTKNRLKEELIVLLKEKPATEIRVKELCELADVNRGTFYYHYSDIFDMVNKLQEEFFHEFNEIIGDMNLSNGKTDNKIEPNYIIEKVFEFFDENAEISEVFIGPNGDKSFLNRLKLLVDEKCSNVWDEAGSHMEEPEYDLFNSFIINGCIGLIETWLKTGRKQSPNYMANCVAKMIIPAAVHTLDIDEDVYR